MPLIFVKIDSFVEALAEQKHNLGSDELMIALSLVTPSTSDVGLADIDEIDYSNLSSRVLTTISSAQISGLYKLVVDDLPLTATGTVGPFRFITLYNNTAVAKNLMGFWDYGEPLTLVDGSVINLAFSAIDGVLDIT